MAYTDILYEKKNGVAWVTINRPEVRNAFRTTTVAELTDAFLDARWDPAIGVVVLGRGRADMSEGAADVGIVDASQALTGRAASRDRGETPLDVAAVLVHLPTLERPVREREGRDDDEEDDHCDDDRHVAGVPA